LDVSLWNVSNVTTFASFIYGCSSLVVLDVSSWMVSNVTTFASFAHSCVLLSVLDVSNWNTSSVTAFNTFIYNCSSITTLDVSNWDTSNVTLIRHAFALCSSLTDIVGFELLTVSSCTDFASMLTGVSLPSTRYSDVLSFNNGWISRGMLNGGGNTIDFGNSRYNDDIPDVVNGRDAIITNSWLITDGGPLPPP